MQLFGEMYGIDLFLACIGSYYVMDEHQAAVATKLVKPKVVIPMHYDTFPVIKADPEDFRNRVNEAMKDVKVEIMKPGEDIELKF
jgi:L-ascorbate metabolism protein UlaG (beta-lactamase superfamily)